MSVTNGRIKVLYIVGWGRSGSTILDNVLGQLDGFFSVGELNYLWERNLIENRSCGCGNLFRACGVWQGIFDRAYGGMDCVDAREMLRLRDRGARTRHLPLMLAPLGKSLTRARLDGYLESLGRLYRGIQEETGSRVIVDSSKLPSYGYVLDMVPGVDLYVVHLVRDSRAVAYSWLRKKFQPDTESFLERHSVFESPVVWSVWNSVSEVFWRQSPERYLRLRYEDFVDQPQEAIGRILGLVRENVTQLPFTEGREVELGVNHTVAGNPSRFETGRVELRLDEEWKSRMKRSDRLVVTALSAPLLWRYGYSLRPVESAAGA